MPLPKTRGDKIPTHPIKRARQALRMRQRDLARALGVSKRTVERWEVDERNPAFPSLIAFAVEAIAARRAADMRATGEIELARLAERAPDILREAWGIEHHFWRPGGRAR